MKRFITSVCMAAMAVMSATFMSAQEEAGQVTLLQVNMKDGAVNKFRLPDSPSVTFEGDNLIIISDGLQGSYLRADVSHFDFAADTQSSVEPSAMNEADFSFCFTDNANVRIASPRLSSVGLYDMSGNRLAEADATDGSVVISVRHLQPGVYIIAPDCHPALKIIKK